MLKQEGKPCELLARPIQTGNRIASRTAVPGRRIRTAHAGALKMLFICVVYLPGKNMLPVIHVPCLERALQSSPTKGQDRMLVETVRNSKEIGRAHV